MLGTKATWRYSIIVKNFGCKGGGKAVKLCKIHRVIPTMQSFFCKSYQKKAAWQVFSCEFCRFFGTLILWKTCEQLFLCIRSCKTLKIFYTLVFTASSVITIFKNLHRKNCFIFWTHFLKFSLGGFSDCILI